MIIVMSRCTWALGSTCLGGLFDITLVHELLLCGNQSGIGLELNERRSGSCCCGSNHCCRSGVVKWLGSKMSCGSYGCCRSCKCCGSDNGVTTEAVYAPGQGLIELMLMIFNGLHWETKDLSSDQFWAWPVLVQGWLRTELYSSLEMIVGGVFLCYGTITNSWLMWRNWSSIDEQACSRYYPLEELSRAVESFIRWYQGKSESSCIRGPWISNPSIG